MTALRASFSIAGQYRTAPLAVKSTERNIDARELSKNRNSMPFPKKGGP
jgi:hypothetical protein